MLRSALELMGLGTETLLIEGAKASESRATCGVGVGLSASRVERRVLAEEVVTSSFGPPGGLEVGVLLWAWLLCCVCVFPVDWFQLCCSRLLALGAWRLAAWCGCVFVGRFVLVFRVSEWVCRCVVFVLVSVVACVIYCFACLRLLHYVHV